jgi:hypothetical protein
MDMKLLRNTKRKTRRDRIRNYIFRQELGIQNMLTELKYKYFTVVWP